MNHDLPSKFKVDAQSFLDSVYSDSLPALLCILEPAAYYTLDQNMEFDQK